MASQDEFLPLFLRYRQEIHSFIAMIVRDPQVQEDLFQETAMTAWQCFERYDNSRPFDSWVRGIARNRIQQHWRKKGKLPVTLDSSAIEAVTEASEEVGEEFRLLEDALRSCMAKIAIHTRRLLNFRYQESLSLAAIAQRLQCTVNAVNLALIKTRSALRRCMESQDQAMEEGGAS